MFARRIWNMRDVNMIVNGIKKGIKDKVFSEIPLMEILRLISSKNATFYIFGADYRTVGDKILCKEDKIVYVGFAAIRNDKEVYKVFVNEECRRKGFGVRISLWIKALILKHGYVPMCRVKQKNKHWNEAMARQGMIEMADSWGGTNKYMLRDFNSYVKAIEKYGIKDIEYLKEKK